MKILTKLQMEEMIHLYTLGIEKNTKNLDKKYGIALGSCYKNLKRRNLLKYRPGEYALSLNQNYFSSINTEDKAYFLGLIAADGHVYKNKNAVSLSLNREDGYDLLFEFLNKIESDTKITLYKDIRTDYKRKETASITLTSKVLKDDLLNLGIYPNKTSSLKFPDLNKNVVRHFIRGFIDGDGSYYYKRGILCTSIVGPYDFLIEMQKIISNELQIPITKLTKHKTGVYYLIYAHKNTEKLRNWLYQNSTISMNRKKQYALRQKNPEYVSKLKSYAK
jgi:hypothetical protein